MIDTIPGELLDRLKRGDSGVIPQILPFVYDHLRRIAGAYFRAQHANHTLNPTALVHEAFLRVAGNENLNWKDRSHFVATYALAMRQILTDHARRRQASKRGGDWQRVTLAGLAEKDGDEVVDLMVLDEALTELATLNERQARVSELRLFGGLSIDEIAYQLEVSSSTVEKEWRMARAWLSLRVSSDETRG